MSLAPPASASRACVPTAYRHGADLTGVLKDYAKSVGADLVGVASAARIVSIATQLKPIYDGQISLKAVDKAHPFTEWNPQISEEPLKVLTAADYVPNAKSVLVIGLRYHEKVVEFATKPPAEAVGVSSPHAERARAAASVTTTVDGSRSLFTMPRTLGAPGDLIGPAR